MKPRTVCAQGAGSHDAEYGGVVPGVYPSTNYRRGADGTTPEGDVYSRDDNPTYLPAERLIAQLEGGEQALLFSSGMAAVAAVIEGLPPGARVLCTEQMYWGTTAALQRWEARDEIRLERLPNPDSATFIEALERSLAVAKADLVWLESPANPMCAVIDLEAAGSVARRHDSVLAVDATLAGPVYVRPLEWGADLVMHSASKQLNGHGDVIAGAVVTRDKEAPLWSRIHEVRHLQGSVLGPFEAWLLMRGLRTLPLRAQAAAATALELATRLDTHPGVTHVMYPGLPHHPDHSIAMRQYSDGFGALLSIRVAGGFAAAQAVARSTDLFVDATSLGGPESLIEHRAPVEGPDSTTPVDLLRLSIGLEDVDDLWEDLSRALARGR